MDLTCEYTDLDAFIKEMEDEIDRVVDSVGQESVEYAVEHGSYQNRTYKLRSSNKYKVEPDGLLLQNDADYASDVEQKGYDVLSGAALFAEKRLKEEFE